MFGSNVVAVARERSRSRRARQGKGLGPGASRTTDKWVWTDDYSNVIGAILKKLREE